jgi:DNA-binding response OmpR family regulator
MTSRVLIADDSLTIQKVIGITLASSGYELVECLNETDLLKKVGTSKFDLILLDFNLSDVRLGYDLAKEVSRISPDAAIIVMLGTFDTVDDSQFEACGIADKIVKPFESTKFIKKCRDLLEGHRPRIQISKKEEVQIETTSSKEDDLDKWKMEAPKMQTHEAVVEPTEVTNLDVKESALDPLTSEIEGWGFGASNSLEDKFQKVFPPVIEEIAQSDALSRLEASSEFNQTLELSSVEEEKNLDVTDSNFIIPDDVNHQLLNEISDDISAEAFWAVDEIVPRKSEEEKDISDTHVNDITEDITDSINAFKNQSFEESAIGSPSVEVEPAFTFELKDKNFQTADFDEDAIVEKLKLSLRPMIEELVKQYCLQSAEKVAWEVIPDLAENLIRKEIKDISESVKH